MARRWSLTPQTSGLTRTYGIHQVRFTRRPSIEDSGAFFLFRLLPPPAGTFVFCQADAMILFRIRPSKNGGPIRWAKTRFSSLLPGTKEILTQMRYDLAPLYPEWIGGCNGIAQQALPNHLGGWPRQALSDSLLDEGIDYRYYTAEEAQETKKICPD